MRVSSDMGLRALLRVIDFFIPVDVLSAVLLVFAMENVLEYYFTIYVGESATGQAWLVVYVLGLLLVAALNVLSADAEEIDELEDDVDDLLD